MRVLILLACVVLLVACDIDAHEVNDSLVSEERLLNDTGFEKNITEDCIHWFDGCNYCSQGPDGVICTLLDCSEEGLEEPYCITPSDPSDVVTDTAEEVDFECPDISSIQPCEGELTYQVDESGCSVPVCTMTPSEILNLTPMLHPQDYLDMDGLDFFFRRTELVLCSSNDPARLNFSFGRQAYDRYYFWVSSEGEWSERSLSGDRLSNTSWLNNANKEELVLVCEGTLNTLAENGSVFALGYVCHQFDEHDTCLQYSPALEIKKIHFCEYRIENGECIVEPRFPEDLTECEYYGGEIVEITECDGSKSSVCVFSEDDLCYIEDLVNGSCTRYPQPKVVCDTMPVG